jgi:hypothetical protein
MKWAYLLVGGESGQAIQVLTERRTSLDAPV